MPETIVRRRYLDKLMRFRDRPDLIKVITGIRRCGKSTLLKQFEEHLLDAGIPKERIVYINFESSLGEPYVSRGALISHLKDRCRNGRTYILLDGIQRVDGLEAVLDALHTDADADIYLTGSNPYFPSARPAGRYVEIRMLPLSFEEFMDINGRTDVNDCLRRYLNRGGMPIIHDGMDHADAQDILNNINYAILLNDVIARNGVRDAAGLLSTVGYIYTEIGNVISPSSVAEQLKISDKTAGNYLRMLEDSHLIMGVDRYDIAGKKTLSSGRKYYCTDLGMRNAHLRARIMDIGKMMENAVFLELKRRGYRVSVGKYGGSEIDFVADRDGTTEYYQISQTASEDRTGERELAPLLRIGDNYPKTVITLNRTSRNQVKGIKYTGLADFLLANDGGMSADIIH
ncbi:MAG: ATP-binding protein [Candidatus Methanoplasma sp.]|jgi:predicted AAA+ superfamily ATPase|nr:ATP-binding protein [Candidatus Methanoplasma sp.]